MIIVQKSYSTNLYVQSTPGQAVVFYDGMECLGGSFDRPRISRNKKEVLQYVLSDIK